MRKGKTNPKDGLKRRREKPGVEPEESQAKINPRRNLLCFDSGGARSLSSLLILDKLLEEMSIEEQKQGLTSASPRKPYEYFDMIGGTGTGGLLAIMLGRLKMDINDCLKEFRLILKNVYRGIGDESKPMMNSMDPMEVKEAWKRFTMRNSKRMEAAAKSLVKRYGGDEDLMFFDESETLCEVFVCSLVADTAGLIPLTTYQTIRGSKRRLQNIKVWEAIKATTAVPTYFEPVPIIAEDYTEILVSGEIGAANPVQMLWNEGKEKFELTYPLIPADPFADKDETKDHEELEEDSNRDLGTLISIGSGLPHLDPFETHYDQMMASVYRVATDRESMADAFQRTNFNLDLSQRCLRLNVLQGLTQLEFYDASEQDLHDITRASNNYIGKTEFTKSIHRFLNISKHRPQRETFDQIALASA